MQKEEEKRTEEEAKQEQSDLDSEINSEITFLQEKIKERPVNRRKLIRRTVITALMAMIFGLVACVTFLLLEPIISRMIYPEEEAEIVRFPEEEEEVDPEDMAADEAELQIIRQEEVAENLGGEAPGENPDNVTQEITAGEEAAVPETEEEQDGETQEEGENEVSPEEEAGMLMLRNYQELYDVLGELRTETEKSLVTVTTVISDVNWINDTLENTGVTSGLIVADNGRELLILTDYSRLRDADRISISFGESWQKEAQIKEVDYTTQLAVLSVPLSEFSEQQKQDIRYAQLGSSLGKALVGQPVMAVGAPIGISGSASYGMVTSQGISLGLKDSDYKLITTDIYGSRSASGVLVNMQGQVVGILYNGYENEDMQNRLCAIGISSLKKTIEKLSNGEQMVYMGIHGAEINASVYEEYELPQGAYITAIDMDSPAMHAGLQSGDIIIKAGDTDIVSHAEFVSILMKSRIGQNLTLTVARQGQGEGKYQEMTIEITLEEQPQA